MALMDEGAPRAAGDRQDVSVSYKASLAPAPPRATSSWMVGFRDGRSYSIHYDLDTIHRAGTLTLVKVLYEGERIQDVNVDIYSGTKAAG